MKNLSIVIVLVGAILYQISLSGCFLPSLRLFRAIESINSNDKLRELGNSLAASVRLPVEQRLKKMRLFYLSKYSRKASLRSTITVSSTSIITVTTALYCARIQNFGVTGACSRRRKELQLNDNKIIANYDDEIEVVQPTSVLNR